MSAKVIELLPSRRQREDRALAKEGQAAVRAAAARVWRRKAHVIAWEDLLSIGNVALAEVMPTYDAKLGELRQYAWLPIHGAMVEAVKDETRLQGLMRRGSYKAIEVQTDQESLESFSDALLAGMAANLAGERLRTEDLEEDEAFRETLFLVRRAVSELSAEDQRLVELHYVKDLALEVAGMEMGMGRTTVKARHRGMLKRLAARLLWHGVVK